MRVHIRCKLGGGGRVQVEGNPTQSETHLKIPETQKHAGSLLWLRATRGTRIVFGVVGHSLGGDVVNDPRHGEEAGPCGAGHACEEGQTLSFKTPIRTTI